MATTKRNGLPEEAVEPTDKPPAGFEKTIAVPTPLQVGNRRKRVMVYVDGYNLYYGMYSKYQRRYLWLDLHALSTSLLKDDQVLVGVKYFTARRRNAPDSAARQALYLGALRATGVQTIEGRFQEKTVECHACGAVHRSYEEKESDVNFCVHLLDDAHHHDLDVALILTADSDMAPAVRQLKRRHPDVRVVAVSPPNRNSNELARCADSHMRLGRGRLAQSQLPAEVSKDGKTWSRPDHWS